MKKRNESTLLTACLQFLKAMENQGAIAWCDRLNSGNHTVHKQYTLKTGPMAGTVRNHFHRVRGCRPGTPDAYFFGNNGQVYWVETKAGTGLNDEQIAFKRMAERIGQRYIVVKDIDTLRYVIAKEVSDAER